MFFRSKVQKIELLISRLSKEELRLAHEKIAQRMLLLRNQEQAQILKSLQLGDRVFFQHKNERVEGSVIKLNKVSAQIIDTKNRYWKISPSLLTKVS